MRLEERSRVACAMAIAVGLSASSAPDAQRLQALRAEWRDLETWSRAVTDARQNELGLGLHLSGSNGPTLMAFIGRLDLRDPSTPPREITVQVATAQLSNPNVIRRPTLVFVVDGTSEKRTELDLTTTLVIDDPTPGGFPANGLAQLRTPEFVRLAEALTIEGSVLGLNATFRRDQIEALRALAARLHIQVKPRDPNAPLQTR